MNFELGSLNVCERSGKKGCGLGMTMIQVEAP